MDDFFLMGFCPISAQYLPNFCPISAQCLPNVPKFCSMSFAVKSYWLIYSVYLLLANHLLDYIYKSGPSFLQYMI